MKMKGVLPNIGFRIVLLGLFVFSASEAWGNFCFYQAERTEKVSEWLNRVPPWLSHNPERLKLLSKAGVERALRSDEKRVTVQALGLLEDYVKTMPYDGSAYLQMAFLRARLFQTTGAARRLRPEEWKSVQSLLTQAKQKNPHDARIRFQAGKLRLSFQETLSFAETEEAIRDIQAAIRLRFLLPDSPFLDLPSGYLEEAHSFLWDRFQSFDFLSRVTPPDLVSEEALLKFIERKGLWPYHPAVWERLKALKEAAYFDFCQKGEEFLGRSDKHRAFLAFRKAFWIQNWFYLRAKAGMMAAWPGTIHADSLMPWQEKAAVTLQTLLESGEEDLRGILPWLYPLIDSTGDPYLLGLYEFRTGKLEAAKRHLKNRADPLTLAQIDFDLQHFNEALNRLKPVLQQTDPDPRAFELMRQAAERAGDSQTLESIDQKIKSIRNESGMKEPAVLHLKDPEKTISLRLFSQVKAYEVYLENLNSSESVLLFSLEGKPLKEIVLPGKEAGVFLIPLLPVQGKRWLTVRLINQENGKGENPSVRFKPVQVLYS